MLKHLGNHSHTAVNKTGKPMLTETDEEAILDAIPAFGPSIPCENIAYAIPYKEQIVATPAACMSLQLADSSFQSWYLAPE